VFFDLRLQALKVFAHVDIPTRPVSDNNDLGHRSVIGRDRRG